MASTILTPVADAIVALIEDLDVSPTVKAYRWAPKSLVLPAAVIEMPNVRRTGVDEPEDHLGAEDWTLTYPVVFYFDLSRVEFSQEQAVQTIEAFVAAVDDSGPFAAGALAAKVTSAEPSILTDQTRPQLVYETTVEVLRFVAT